MQTFDRTLTTVREAQELLYTGTAFEPAYRIFLADIGTKVILEPTFTVQENLGYMKQYLDELEDEARHNPRYARIKSLTAARKALENPYDGSVGKALEELSASLPASVAKRDARIEGLDDRIFCLSDPLPQSGATTKSEYPHTKIIIYSPTPGSLEEINTTSHEFVHGVVNRMKRRLPKEEILATVIGYYAVLFVVVNKKPEELGALRKDVEKRYNETYYDDSAEHHGYDLTLRIIDGIVSEAINDAEGLVRVTRSRISTLNPRIKELFE